MLEPYQPASDVHVLPAALPVPGVGFLTVNAFVLHAEQPVLVDTGMGMFSDAFIDAVASVVPLADLRWIWITHDDADHVGSLPRLMELAPQVRVVTHGMTALRQATAFPFALDRVYAIRAGDKFDVGDRVLQAVRPPLFDNPMSTGFVDTSTGALFSVDSFGALIPEPTEDAGQVPDEALAGGMVGWATLDSPWVGLVDGNRFGPVVDEVRKLAPTRILSSHLPAAGGEHVERFCDLLTSLPDAPPFPALDNDQFQAMVAAIAAMTGEPPPPAG